MSKFYLQRRASFKAKDNGNAFFFKGHMPLYSEAESVEDLKTSTFFLFLFEIFSRSVEFAILLPALSLYVGFAVARATIFNLAFILGGFKSDKIFYLAGKYNQLAIKSVFFVIFDTCAFLIEQLYLLVGLVFPSVVLNSLGKKIDFDSCKVDGAQDRGELYEGQYLYYVYCIGAFLQRHNFISMSMVVMSLLCEPVDSIVHGLRMLFSPRNLKAYGANPETLTAEQKNMAPVLFLHGSGHDESAFMQFLYDFRNSSQQRPLFTVKLPEVTVFEGEEYERQESVRQAVMNEKIVEIRRLYGNFSVEPVIIGHSSGADAAVIRRRSSSKRDSTSTQQIYILLGANARASNGNDKYFTGRNDEILCLESEVRQFQETRDQCSKKLVTSEYFTGHLGLLTDPKVINDCITAVDEKALRPVF